MKSSVLDKHEDWLKSVSLSYHVVVKLSSFLHQTHGQHAPTLDWPVSEEWVLIHKVHLRLPLGRLPAAQTPVNISDVYNFMKFTGVEYSERFNVD